MTLDEINQRLDDVVGEFDTSVEACIRAFGQGLRAVIDGSQNGNHKQGVVGALVLHRLQEMETMMNQKAEKILHEELYK